MTGRKTDYQTVSPSCILSGSAMLSLKIVAHYVLYTLWWWVYVRQWQWWWKWWCDDSTEKPVWGKTKNITFAFFINFLCIHTHLLRFPFFTLLFTRFIILYTHTRKKNDKSYHQKKCILHKTRI